MRYNKTIIALLFCAYAHSMSAMHFSDYVNVVFRPEMHRDKRYELTGMVERGVGTKSFDSDGCVANVLRIWETDQNALKMLYGFPLNSPIGQLNMRLNATDDGQRGHFLVCGDLDLIYNAAVGFRYRFFDDFIIGLFLPFRSMRLSNVSWLDQTKSIEEQDFRVKELLTNDIVGNVQELGCLDICGWQREGFGDLALILDWNRDFPQAKPMLKNVQLLGELGLLFPTGLPADENLVFGIPFGTDGGVGVLFGGGLYATLGDYFRTGVDVELLHIFSNSKMRRIKTNRDQTELLLLEKVCALRDWGLNQQFTLRAEFFDFFKGLSFGAYYQYTRDGEDFLSLETQAFSTSVANSSISLQEWTAHNFIAMMMYDFGHDECVPMRAKPQLNFFVKIPFNGKRSALFTTVGGQFSIDF